MTPPFLWFSAAFCNENSQHPDLQDDRGLSDESQGDTEKIKMMKMAVSLNPSHYQTKTILTNLVLKPLYGIYYRFYYLLTSWMYLL